MKKIIGIISLMFLIAAGVVFAFWASSVTVDDGKEPIIINVGEPLDADTYLSTTVIEIVSPKLVPMGGAILTYNNEEVMELAVIDIMIEWTGDHTFAMGLEATFTIDVKVELDTYDDDFSDDEELFFTQALDLIKVLLIDATSETYAPTLAQIQDILNRGQRTYMIPTDVEEINDTNEVEEFNETFTLEFNEQVQFLLLVYIERADMNTVKYLTDAGIKITITITLDDDNEIFDYDYGDSGE